MRVLIHRGASRLAQRRGRLWVPAFYLGLACFFYLPVVVGLATFEPGDFHDHFVPFSQFLQRELLSGRLPVWNPYTYAGHPFLADVQSGAYYLPSYPFVGLGAWAGTDTAAVIALQWEALIHTAVAGWGMHFLLMRLTGSRRGSLVAGVAWMLSGFLVGYAPLQVAVLRSVVWIPWAMALLWQGIHTPRRWGLWPAGALCAALIVLGGHAQSALYAAYLLGAWSVLAMFHAFGPGRARADAPAALLGTLLTVVLAIGLAAGQLWPAWEFLGLSVRSALEDAAAGAGLPIQDTWQLLLPGVFSQFSPLYVGAGGIVLALFAVAAACWGRAGDFYVLPRTQTRTPTVATAHHQRRHEGRSVAVFFAVVAVFGLLAAFGNRTPLYGALAELLPGWSLFRGQERAAVLVALSLAALAGLGAAWLPTAGRTLRKRSALILGGGITVSVYGFGLLYQLLDATAVGDYVYLWVAFYTLAAGLAVCLLLWVDGWGPGRTLILVAVVGGNLLVANAFVNLAWGTPAARAAWDIELQAMVATKATDHTDMDSLPPRYYNEFRLAENYGMRIGVEDVWGASPLRLANYARLFDAFPLDRMWTLTGVEYVLTWRRDLFVPSTRLGEFPRAEDTTYLHRLTEPMPRAWTVAEIRVVADDSETLAQLADHAVNLRNVAFVAPDPARAWAASLPLADGGLTQGDLGPGDLGQGDVVMTKLGPGHFALTVDTPQAAYLVISENWLPGWQVVATGCAQTGDCFPPAREETAAGMPAFQPMRTNLTFLGMAVPAGESTFELVYRPQSVRHGAWVTGGSVVVWLLLVVFAWRRKSAAESMV